MKAEKLKEISQVRAFITSMHETGWRTITAWEDGGHTFELLNKARARMIVQIYPGGEGFEAWRPVTEANGITETRIAVEDYANSINAVESTSTRGSACDPAGGANK